MVNHIQKTESKPILNPESKNAFMKVLVGQEQGWDDYVMRVVEVEKDGYTPKHSHPWPHINYMISGEGELMINGVFHPVKAGNYAFVEPNQLHQFRNIGEEVFRFICIVPKIGHQ